MEPCLSLANPDDLNVAFLLKILQGQIIKNLNRLAAPYDLTAAQTAMLRFIDEQNRRGKHVSQRDIERHFHQSNPTVTGVLSRLEGKNLIQRTKSPKDGRINLISLTDEGGQLIKKLEANFQEVEKMILKGISPKHVTELKKMLIQMIQNLSGKETLNDQNPCCSN